MIDSILYCLLGTTGGIFLETEKEFKINENINKLTESEKECLISVCKIGQNYKMLFDFINNYENTFNNKLMKTSSFEENSQNNENNVRKETIYLSGVCRTTNELLTEYRHIISSLESKFYIEQNLTLNEILTEISPYIIKFEKLQDFISIIYRDNLKGGKFLNYIYECGINGDPHIKSLFKSLFINCNIILNNMISMWIINNLIQSNEFFIVSSNNFIIEEDFINGENHDLESWKANYYIEKNNIPIYFPNNLVEDILFVGKAIKILNSNKNSEECKISFNDMSIFYTSLQKLNEIIFRQNEEINNLIDIELYNKILTLIKNCVSKFLWKLVVNKNGFINHLNAVRNMFLTYHGEFIHNFITKIQDLLNLPNFNKKIENEINDVYFKSSLKEVFHIDTNQENYFIYNPFRIKLISSGFIFNFQNEANLKNYIEKRDINYLGGINYDTVSNSFRLINTTYKSSNGTIWNSSNYDLDEEFLLTSNFILKNFSKKENEDLIHKEKKRESMIKQKSINNRNEIPTNRSIIINYIMHLSKNFPSQPPLNLSELTNFFNFQFLLNYEEEDNPSKLTSIIFRLYYLNKTKSIEKEIFSTIFNNINNQKININDIISPSEMSNINISFKENYCTIYNEEKTFSFSFPFMINSFISKDKRKMNVGMIVQSQNCDMIFEFISWSCNFYSGEIYNENSNLILINYNPPWPHNFIFNENILKLYNNIFNLVFPLKTSLTMLNSLWVEKKNICNNYNLIFKLIDSVHAEFICFLQNLISFYMFDVVEVNFKKFFEKIPSCKDLEDLMKFHEEFLNDVTANSFVKSKKLMRMIFDILFVVRKFHNYVQNFIKNLKEKMILNNNKDLIIDNEETIKEDLMNIKNEFKLKVNTLITSFNKIKNTKHFNVITQLLSKLESHNYY